MEKIKECRKRKATTTSEATVTDTPGKKQSHVFPMQTVGGAISQRKVDKLVLNFIVEYMEPMSIVESQPFIDLVQGLQPTRKVMSRKTLNG
jgi:hypothetical protein